MYLLLYGIPLVSVFRSIILFSTHHHEFDLHKDRPKVEQFQSALNYEFLECEGIHDIGSRELEHKFTLKTVLVTMLHCRKKQRLIIKWCLKEHISHEPLISILRNMLAMKKVTMKQLRKKWWSSTSTPLTITTMRKSNFTNSNTLDLYFQCVKA
jgi:hypothetical protein